MSHVPIARFAVAALVLRSCPAAAGQVEIDLPAAIERARRFAPEAVAAAGRVAEADAGVVGAEVAFTTNPELEGGVGPRFTPGRPLDAEVRLEQNLEPWRRGPRRELARAQRSRVGAELDHELRALELAVSVAFYEAVFAQRAAELAARAQDLAQRAAAVAERRRKAGDVTELDANLARAASGRARSAGLAAETERALAVGRLAALIGAAPDDVITLRGELKPAPPRALAAARGALTSRADVRVLDAEREIAAARRAQATAAARPEIAIWAAYQREDTADLVLGGVRISLPLWNRGQGEHAAAIAGEDRATLTREATLRAAERQVADALAAYASAQRAVDTFEREVAPVLDDSEQLLQQTVDAGQIAVHDYLVARQELATGRREYLERLLGLARAAAAVRFVAGGPP